MTQVTIKIELNNLDKAMTEVKALETYIKELAKTYPTAGIETETPVETPKPAKKAMKKAEPKPTPAKEEKAVKTPSEEKIDLAGLTALAKKAVTATDRETVKALITKHGASKLSALDEAEYPALKAELEKLVG